ncbi:unnamed protein product [Kuraishia capsulata CBS 1993]|uniref:AAA+ ATPase domain-containing protein n=1 Tax=Kuraishia capsulata CBS 1993 TaxID=1382522 RepID=W6ML84_9ASCO|nr:uncharacterized protein KUCA_T00003204001 [Kuraishia capsulata CBS 1993]CDK27226.1 unnamed protein product [Kuraishia capsulata CBS 1993]
MFRRKKTQKPPPPLTKILEVYNETAALSLNNLSLEQNKRPAEALQGWKTLHNLLVERLEALDGHITGLELTDEEAYVLDEIRILQAQADDHLVRLVGVLESQPQLQASPSKRTFAASTSSSNMNVPTLRTSNPQPMNTKKSAPRPLMKTLRGNGSNPSVAAASSTNAGAKQAANAIWNDEPHRVWSPSTSLSAGKSYSTPEDAFRDFDSVSERDTADARAETFEMLENTGNSSRVTRKIASKSHKSEEDLLDLKSAFTSLAVSKSHPKPKQKPQSQPQPQSQQRPAMSANSANALKKSAAVKPISNIRQTRSPQPPHQRQPIKSTPVDRSHAATSAKLVTQQNARPRPAQSTAQTPVQSQSHAQAQSKPQSQPQSQYQSQSQSQSQSQPQSRTVRVPAQSRSRTPVRVVDDGLLKDTETLEQSDDSEGEDVDEDKLIASLRGVDPLAAKQIMNEIIVHGDEVYWDDIAGLESAKNSLKETVVYPFLRPDLFSGLREPARGMLLFGPPGTGKTMLARAVATESKSTFFSISASSLTSKYLGESEKLVRALFQLAKKLAPSIIFVDEIDSLLSSRNNEGENESSRRIKNEFLVQWSDLTKAAAGRDQGEDAQRVLVLAATNLPWAIDEAARRRFVRRQYIPLPEYETRKVQLLKLLSFQNHTLSESDFEKLIAMTESFSGSDITALAKDAAMGPLRELGDKLLLTRKSEIRPISLVDFVNSLTYIRPSVSKEGLLQFEDWAEKYGSSGV